MPDWYLVPCLVQLRTEFNALSPDRDKGADGSIGDTAHQAESTSDHNPDALGRVLAVDIDSTGPWPADFDALVKYIVGRQRSGADNRLQYVIWNRRIASRSTNWAWATYTGTADPHTGHAHFSARHDHTVNTSGSITAYSRLADIAGGVAALQVTAQGVLANVQADDGDLAAIKADALAKYNGLVAEINQVDDEVWAKISDPSTPNEQVAAALVSLLGPRKAAVVALMQQS
jgi:hypothetical protein